MSMEPRYQTVTPKKTKECIIEGEGPGEQPGGENGRVHHGASWSGVGGRGDVVIVPRRGAWREGESGELTRVPAPAKVPVLPNG
jgi:hypothetical protein